MTNEKIVVFFFGGTSRIDGEPCTYMIAEYTSPSGEKVELYAEYEAPPGLKEDEVSDFDWEACPVLKKEIIRQAAETGIAADDLEFFRFY